MSDIGHYDPHPAYRNQALLIADDIKLGRDRNTVPNWEVEVGRGSPWFGGTSVAMDDRGVNPACSVYEPMTCDVMGLGLSDAELYQPGFEAFKTAFDAADFKISPLLTQPIAFKQYMANLSQLTDCWLRVRGTQIELGYWKQGLSQAQINALPVIGSDDLTEEPDLPSAGYGPDTVTKTYVTYADRGDYFHADNVVAPNPGLEHQLGKLIPTQIDASWAIIDGDIAAQFASNYANKYGRPSINGSLMVKVEKVEAIEDAAGGAPIVGLLVKTDIASLGYEIVFRVVACDYPADGDAACRLTVESERSIWPGIYTQPPPKKIGNFKVDVPEIANHRVVELPSGLTTKNAIQLQVLAQRPQEGVLGFHVYTSLDDATYDPAPKPCTFAAWGKIVDADFVSGGGAGMHVKLFGVDKIASQTTTQRDDYTLLCFVEAEILSVGVVTPLGGGVYQVGFRNALYGTAAATHAIGKQVFFIARSDLVPIANKNFAIGATIYLKAVPFDAHQTFDITDAASFPYTFGGGAVGTPTALSLTAISGVTSDGAINAAIVATWTVVTDQDVSYFNVGLRRTGDTAWDTTNNGAETTFKRELLLPGVSYQVRVQAVNAAGQASDWSAVASITTITHATLGIPFFTNDYTGAALVSRTYDDLSQLSIRAHTGTAGRMIRFAQDAHVQPDSDFWGWYPANHGGVSPGFPTVPGREGTGTNDFIGYIQADGLPGGGGSQKSTSFHVCIVDPAFDSVLGPEVVISFVWGPIDQSQWPEVPRPYSWIIGGSQGSAGFQVGVDCVDASAHLYKSTVSNEGPWVRYQRGASVTLGVGANVYFQARRYDPDGTALDGSPAPLYDNLKDSPVLTIANTTTGVPNAGGGGGGGGIGRIPAQTF